MGPYLMFQNVTCQNEKKICEEPESDNSRRSMNVKMVGGAGMQAKWEEQKM